MLSRSLRAALFAMLLVTSCLAIYRFAVVGVPRADQFWLMQHRPLAGSDWKFFVNTLSYNRTRTIAAGDFYVFRPLMTGSLAVVDIASRPNLYVAGVLSILYHAACCLGLAMILFRLGPSWLKWLVLPHFLVQYSGMDLILWRHVSPYILGVACFGIGLYLILRRDENQNSNWSLAPAAVAFFVAALFHEALVLFLGVAAVLCWLRTRDLRSAVALAAAPVLYLTLNIAVAVYYGVSEFWTSGDRGWAISPGLLTLAGLWTSGATAVAFVAPWTVHFRFEFAERTWWRFNELGPVVLLAGAALGMLALYALVKQALRRRTFSDSHELARFLTIGTLLTLLGAIAYARTYQRGLEYLMMSTYNFYISNFLLCVLLGGLLAKAREPKWQRVALAVSSIYLGVSALLSYVRIVDSTGLFQARERIIAESNLAVFEALRGDRKLCFAGIGSRALQGIVMPILHYEVSCEVRRSRPVVATVDAEGEAWLVSVEPGNRAVRIRLADHMY